MNLNVDKVANAQVGLTVVQNDFDNIYPWSDIKTYDYNTVTGEKVWIDEEGFTFSPTGNVEVLTYIPEFYYRRYRDGNDEYISISKLALPGYTRSAPFSVGRYMMNVVSNVGHSRSGTEPTRSQTITQFRNYAKALNQAGSNIFGIMDYHYMVIQILYLVEYADYNIQAKIGPGYSNFSYTAPLNNGTLVNGISTNDLGMKSGSINGTDNSPMIYRGIENIYGNVVQFIDGINIQNYKAYICYNQAKYAVDTFVGCYKPIGYTNATTNNYVSKLGYDSIHPLASFPTETNGTGNTYITDYYWQSTGNLIAAVGGCYDNGDRAGIFIWNFDHVYSYTHNRFGARLIKLEN